MLNDLDVDTEGKPSLGCNDSALIRIDRVNRMLLI